MFQFLAFAHQAGAVENHDQRAAVCIAAAMMGGT